MKKKPTIAAKRTLALSLGHEPSEFNIWPAVISTASVAATVIIACIVSHWVFGLLARPSNQRSATPMYGEGLVLPPSPRLEGIDMLSGIESKESAAAASQVHSYGWTDRDKRLVHVPIDRAMQLAIELNWLPSSTPEPDSDHVKSPPNGKVSTEQKAANQ
jgi:hypothetical protein